MSWGYSGPKAERKNVAGQITWMVQCADCSDVSKATSRSEAQKIWTRHDKSKHAPARRRAVKSAQKKQQTELHERAEEARAAKAEKELEELQRKDAEFQKANPITGRRSAKRDKKGKCRACGKKDCSGRKPNCVRAKAVTLKGNTTRHGLKNTDGTSIPAGQNVNGIVYDAKGRRVWLDADDMT